MSDKVACMWRRTAATQPQEQLSVPHVTQRVLLLAATLLFAGCAHVPAINASKAADHEAAEARRNLLIGRWYGETPATEGGKRLEITDKAADGTFTIQFRVIERSGKVSDQTEVGLWGITGPVFFSITRGWLFGGQLIPADPTRATYYDAYEILELTAERFRYKSFASGEEYTVNRVSADFSFPQ